MALQFHWDYSLQSVETMIRHCGDELIAGAPGTIRVAASSNPPRCLPTRERFDETKVLLYEMLDGLAEGKDEGKDEG